MRGNGDGDGGAGEGAGCQAAHRGGEPSQAMWRGGASGEPPRAMTSRPTATGPYGNRARAVRTAAGYERVLGNGARVRRGDGTRGVRVAMRINKQWG